MNIHLQDVHVALVILPTLFTVQLLKVHVCVCG